MTGRQQSATCDTSVLVPALVEWHPQHETCRDVLLHEVSSLPVHVLLECYSVLTRLPAPHRISAPDAASVLGLLDRKPISLPAHEQSGIIGLLAEQGLRGGAVYDALIARTASHHGLRLYSRDRRARATYDALRVPHSFV